MSENVRNGVVLFRIEIYPYKDPMGLDCWFWPFILSLIFNGKPRPHFRGWDWGAEEALDPREIAFDLSLVANRFLRGEAHTLGKNMGTGARDQYLPFSPIPTDTTKTKVDLIEIPKGIIDHLEIHTEVLAMEFLRCYGKFMDFLADGESFNYCPDPWELLIWVANNDFLKHTKLIDYCKVTGRNLYDYLTTEDNINRHFASLLAKICAWKTEEDDEWGDPNDVSYWSDVIPRLLTEAETRILLIVSEAMVSLEGFLDYDEALVALCNGSYDLIRTETN